MQKITFEDLPSTNTPLNANNLNALQSNVESAFNNTYGTSQTEGYSCNFINNLLYIGYVDIEISKTADSEANLTMTVPTGYRFLTWYGCITLGWVGSVYIENMLEQTTKIHNNITKGTGNGWTRNYYLCVKGS